MDSFKAIAAFMVVYLHYSVGTGTETFFSDLCRIAIPFFFMVSGFFLYEEKEERVIEKCRKNIKKMLILTVVGNGLQLCRNMPFVLIRGEFELLSGLLDAKFLLFNFEYASYMWFVRALLYLYLLVWILQRLLGKRMEYLTGMASVLFLILNLIFCKYSAVLGMDITGEPYVIPSKLLGTAFPNFFAGYFIRKLYESGRIVKAKQYLYGGITTAAVILLYIEVSVLDYFGKNVPTCDYLATYVIVVSLFLWLLAKPDFSPWGICRIGYKYSMWIYILHMNIRELIEKLHLEQIVLNEKLLSYGRTVAAYSGSILISMVLLGLWERWRTKRDQEARRKKVELQQRGKEKEAERSRP